VFLMASRFDPAKGHRVLLDALASMREVQGWTCWIAGGASGAREAAHLAAMRALAEGGGIAGRVRFLGERADVPRLMAAADVLCQPNLSPDAFGIAFVEGMYAGLPVVTSALGGALEAVDPTTGILVAPGRVDALAEALRELAGRPGRRAELGAAGPARARALCDPHRQAERMRQVLATVAGQG
jgi:glycosyltransferase involved in cell wall biosynthesis